VSAESEGLRDAAQHNLWGVLGPDCHKNLWGVSGHAPRETPSIQHHHFGAVIALHIDNLMTHHLIAEPDGDT
jgi:hypothetical protein